MIITFSGPILEMPGGSKTVYRFEDHRYCGPCKLNKDDSIAARNFGEQHPFWQLYQRWVALGKPVKDGVCQLELDLPPELRPQTNGGEHD